MPCLRESDCMVCSSCDNSCKSCANGSTYECKFNFNCK